MTRPLPALVVACAALLAATGCVSTPPARFYTLNAVAAPAALALGVSVAVGPVSVPAEVDQPQIVVSAGPNQLLVDEFNRWAAPLQNNIARVVAENLVALLGTPRVTLYPQAISTDIDYRVGIEVQGFGSAPGDSASLDAVWTVRRMKDGKTEAGRTTLREPAREKGYDALAAAHSRALGRLAQDIAGAVRSLDRSAR